MVEKTRNQVVQQWARGFESHPVRQLCGFAYFCEPAFTLCFLPNFVLNLSIIRYHTLYSSSLLLRKPYPHNQDENKYLPLSHNHYDRVSFEFVSYLHRFSALCSLPRVCNRKALISDEPCDIAIASCLYGWIINVFFALGKQPLLAIAFDLSVRYSHILSLPDISSKNPLRTIYTIFG